MSVSEPDRSIVDIGREFAFEGLEPKYFQSKSEEEFKAFMLGYREGLRVISESKRKAENQQLEEAVSIKK